jgi:hypothetical protein
MVKKQQHSQKERTKWKIHAYYLDACNCDWGCPCQFNANPTHGNCDGQSGIYIIDGNYGDDVKLNELNIAYIGSFSTLRMRSFSRAIRPFNYFGTIRVDSSYCTVLINSSRIILIVTESLPREPISVTVAAV